MTSEKTVARDRAVAGHEKISAGQRWINAYLKCARGGSVLRLTGLVPPSPCKWDCKSRLIAHLITVTLLSSLTSMLLPLHNNRLDLYAASPHPTGSGALLVRYFYGLHYKVCRRNVLKMHHQGIRLFQSKLMHPLYCNDLYSGLKLKNKHFICPPAEHKKMQFYCRCFAVSFVNSTPQRIVKRITMCCSALCCPPKKKNYDTSTPLVQCL